MSIYFCPLAFAATPPFIINMQFAMWVNGISDLLHYLDNYFMAGPADSGECQHNINTMVKVCRELGFTVNPTKATDPSPITCFLGIDIDLHKGVACIDPECLEAITCELVGFKQAKLATKHEILSFIGKLHFVCRVCPQLSIPVQDDRGVQEGMSPTSLCQAEDGVPN